MPIAHQHKLTGFPSLEASEFAQDQQDFERAITAYRFWYPTVSAEGIFNGNREMGIADNEGLPILAAAPRHLGFTLNSDTPYGGGAIDLSVGPMVVEIPPGPYIGLANDHHQRWIMDMGIPGPDAGKGGKHLILPPGYDREPPAGYYVGRSSSMKVLVAVRSMPVNGDVQGALEALTNIKIYPLATADNPKLVKFIDVTNSKMDATLLRWEEKLDYWRILHKIIDAEPVVEEFRPMYGLLSAIGIEKGKPFAPNARMRAILERAAKKGKEQMMVSAFASVRPDRLAWSDRQWEWIGLVPNSGDFETPAGLDIEARDRWFGQAIVGSPAMFRRQVGYGSLYWLCARDSSGLFLDGGLNYRLVVPTPVPAKLFWSVTVYDAATRSEVQTPQDKAALRSLFELKNVAKSGNVELFFGPDAPTAKDAAWIQTLPSRGWFAYFRIYGPENAAFDGSWKPGDIERAI